MPKYKLENPYLQIFVLSHSESQDAAKFQKEIFTYFTRDRNNPLYRTLGIPVYFFNSI